MDNDIIIKLEQIIRRRIGGDISSLSNAAKRLSDVFTKERVKLPKSYLSDKKLLSAYSAHFFPTNTAKVVHVLNELEKDGSIETKAEYNVLDLGCGTGAAVCAVSDFMAAKRGDSKVNIVAVDNTSEAVAEAKLYFDDIKTENQTLTHKVFEITSDNIGKHFKKFDLIIAANFYNELGGVSEMFEITKKLMKVHLNDNGLLIIIDPALKSTTRDLILMRDMVVKENIGRVLAPCLHQKNCPMIKINDRDWCHFYIEWNKPSLIGQMDKLVGTDHKYLKLAYMVFSGGRKHEAGSTKQKLHRVVSSLLNSKGKSELLLCGGDGELKKVYRLDKDASELNKDFDKVKRGDIVFCEAEKRVYKENKFVCHSRT